MENAGDVEGLSEMLASLDAGDTETVNFVAGLAEAAVNDKQALKDMVKNWQDAKKEQENAAESFAGYVEDLQGRMDELRDGLVEDIEDMNLSDEAAESGALTILGYLDGANSMLPRVRAAFEEIGSAAIEAMVGPYAGVKAVPLSLQVGARGYASGTRSAEPGWAEVGENGPELIFFGGGETVLNAAQTSALRTRAEPVVSAKPAADRFSTGPMQVVFQIDGNATPDTVQDLREFGNEIIARVIDTLDERAADEARRAFR